MSDTGEHIVKMTNCVIMWTHSCAPMGQPSHPAPPPLPDHEFTTTTLNSSKQLRLYSPSEFSVSKTQDS